MCIYIYAQYHTPTTPQGGGGQYHTTGRGRGQYYTPPHHRGGRGTVLWLTHDHGPGGVGTLNHIYIYTYTHQLAYRPYQIGVRRMATFFEIWPSVSECQGRAVGCWYIDTI